MAKEFAITRGGKGSLVFDGQELIEIEPIKVKAIDTVGAGDMYAGAFLYGLTHGMSFAESGNLASLAASRIVTSFGPRLEAEELRGLVVGNR
jgi:sugar/nucleoside kinase (ribokinase family)